MLFLCLKTGKNQEYREQGKIHRILSLSKCGNTVVLMAQFYRFRREVLIEI